MSKIKEECSVQMQNMENGKEVLRYLKKRLKSSTKSELITMMVVQGNNFSELQNVCKELYEENKQLKQQLGQEEETSNDEND